MSEFREQDPHIWTESLQKEPFENTVKENMSDYSRFIQNLSLVSEDEVRAQVRQAMNSDDYQNFINEFNKILVTADIPQLEIKKYKPTLGAHAKEVVLPSRADSEFRLNGREELTQEIIDKFAILKTVAPAFFDPQYGNEQQIEALQSYLSEKEIVGAPSVVEKRQSKSEYDWLSQGPLRQIMEKFAQKNYDKETAFELIDDYLHRNFKVDSPQHLINQLNDALRGVGDKGINYRDFMPRREKIMLAVFMDERIKQNITRIPKYLARLEDAIYGKLLVLKKYAEINKNE